MPRTVAAIATVMLLAACSGATSGEPPTTSATAVSPSTTQTVASVGESVTTTTAAVVTTTLPAGGEPIPGPVPGQLWWVVGVEHDDVLNVRSAAGISAAIIDTLEPTGDTVVTGSAVLLDRSIWWEVERPSGGVGWVNSIYLGAPGITEDVAASVVASEGGIPTAPDMETLVEIVLPTAVGFPADSVVIVAPAVSGDIGEMAIDAFSTEPDDSVRGLRLWVFGQRDGGSGPLALKAVETTVLCWRGADPDGLCV